MSWRDILGTVWMIGSVLLFAVAATLPIWHKRE